MKLPMIFVVILFMTLCSSCATSGKTGFLHARGTSIVDGSGKEILLRGMGFGGWLVMEPYMMNLSDVAKAGQHSILANVDELVGPEKRKIFHEAWLNNFCTEADIAALKKQGFNSIRLPLHYNLFTLPVEEEPVPGDNTWLEKGFLLTDQVLQWCEKHEIYLILDLHAAPGGQGNDANISDYDAVKPSLWESGANRDKTVALWKKLAARYTDRRWIGGYDLINEPNRDLGPGNRPLKELYDRIITAIREVDRNHLIIIEGNWFANDHSGLWPFDDDNIALSFHRYWCENSLESIQPYLDMREEYRVPLYMGESGENSTMWYHAARTLLEDHNIGWAWWTWKKLRSDSGVYSVSPSEGFDQLRRYWKSGGNKPDSAFSFTVLMELTETIRLENAIFNGKVVQSLFSE